MTRPDQTRPDQTRPDQYSVIKYVKKFLKKCGLRRIHYQCLLWPIESRIFRLIPARKKVLIIRPNEQTIGLFCYFLRILGGIAYAERKNMIPVVDMQTCINQYLYDNEIGHVNSWEFYFEQPTSLSLEEALQLENIEVMEIPPYFPYPHPTYNADVFYNSFGQLKYWKKICRKYIRFAPSVIEKVELMKKEHEGKRILGVKLRGTDYITTKAKNHPIPPTTEQTIDKVREVMQEKDFDAVYLATEDQRIVTEFQNAFGDKLILPDVEYVDYDYSDNRVIANWLFNYSIDRPNDKYLSGLEYAVSILFLSCCKGLITSSTNGSVAAMLLTEGFEYLYVFDLGIYS